MTHFSIITSASGATCILKQVLQTSVKLGILQKEYRIQETEYRRKRTYVYNSTMQVFNSGKKKFHFAQL